MTEFKIKWLKGCSAALIVFGAFFAVIDLPVIGIPARLFTELAFLQPLQGAFDTSNRVLVGMSGIVGALTLLVGLLLYGLIEPLAKSHPAILRRTLAIAFCAWYVFDQWASYRGGAYGNMASNTLILLAFLGPLYIGKSHATATAAV